jgi:hypothetical protein
MLNLKTDKKIEESGSKIISVNNLDDQDEEIIENWKGLGESKICKKKSTYVEKDPMIQYYNENSRTKSSVIGILKNGCIAE